MSGRFVCFLFNLPFGLFHFRKKYFKILDVYILVKRPLEKLYLHPQWDPDTHISPHQMGAVSKAKQPLFKAITRFSISGEIKYPITSLVINYYYIWWGVSGGLGMQLLPDVIVLKGVDGFVVLSGQVPGRWPPGIPPWRLSNERPGSHYVIWGPRRGLEKNLMEGGQQQTMDGHCD